MKRKSLIKQSMVHNQISVYLHLFSSYCRIKKREARLLKTAIEGPSQTCKSLKGPAPICDEEINLKKSEVDHGSTCDVDTYCMIGQDESGIYIEWIHMIDTDSTDNYENEQILLTLDETCNTDKVDTTDTNGHESGNDDIVSQNGNESCLDPGNQPSEQECNSEPSRSEGENDPGFQPLSVPDEKGGSSHFQGLSE